MNHSKRFLLSKIISRGILSLLVAVLFAWLMQSCVPTGKSCRFINLYTGYDDCISYTGSGWTAESAEGNCLGLSFLAQDGEIEYSNFACPETTPYTCDYNLFAPEDEKEAKYYFYYPEDMCCQAEGACAGWLNGGTWNGPECDAEPMGTLMPEATQALQDDENVTVANSNGTDDCTGSDDPYDCVRQMADNSEYFVFQPVATTPTTGLIFYPGGRVDARAYAPQARALAEAGYFVALIPMPCLSALYGFDRAQVVMDAFPGIDYWLIGGHSLGGVAAGKYTHDIGGVIGMFLWGTYIASEQDISYTDLPVITIYGANEAVATDPDFWAAQDYLPANAQPPVAIPDGTHCQFGYYGNPKGETITLSWEEQLNATIDAMVPFLADAENYATTREARYEQAALLDEGICDAAQRTLTGMTTSHLPADQLETVWYELGSDFGGAKSYIDSAASPQLTLRGYLQPNPYAGLWAPDSLGLDARCKMRRNDRITAAGLPLLPLPGTEGTCGEINAMTLDAAKAMLTSEELDRYNTEGVELTFGDDIVFSNGIEWLSQNPVMELSPDGITCSLSAPAADIPDDDSNNADPIDLDGVHYCKLLSHSAALYWLTVQAFQPGGCAYPEEGGRCIFLDNPPVASCIFYFSAAQMTFCQDYVGPGWTVEDAQTECDGRVSPPPENIPSVFSTDACVDRPDETSLIDGDGVYRGTCALLCDENIRTWNVYSDSGGIDITQFCPSGWFPAE